MLSSYFQKEITNRKPKRGRMSDETQAEVDSFDDKWKKMQNHEAQALGLLERLRDLRDSGDIARISVNYKYTGPSRARRYSTSPSAQGLSRALLARVCASTEDWDISNCMFTLLTQLFSKMKLTGNLPILQLPCTVRVGADRAAVIGDLGTSPASGKQSLTAVYNGGRVPSVPGNAAFLEELAKEGRMARWVACTNLPDVYADARKSETRRFPESTTLHYFWTPVEDHILRSWCRFVKEKPTAHLSLHFDGIRVDKDRVAAAADFALESELYIERETGFKVKVVRKVHRFFQEFLPVLGQEMTEVDHITDALLEDGNCIPCAWCHLIPSERESVVDLLSRKSAGNLAASMRHARSYCAWKTHGGHYLQAYYGLNTGISHKFMIHVDCAGAPHCFAAQIDGDTAYVYDGRRRYTLTVSDLQRASEEAVDYNSLVTFALIEGECPADDEGSASQAITRAISERFRTQTQPKQQAQT